MVSSVDFPLIITVLSHYSLIMLHALIYRSVFLITSTSHPPPSPLLSHPLLGVSSIEQDESILSTQPTSASQTQTPEACMARLRLQERAVLQSNLKVLIHSLLYPQTHTLLSLLFILLFEDV